MAKKQKPTTAPADNGLKNVSDYRFPEATRKNNPPAKIAAEGFVPLIPKGRSTCTVRGVRRNSGSIQRAAPTSCPSCWRWPRTGGS